MSWKMIAGVLKKALCNDWWKSKEKHHCDDDWSSQKAFNDDWWKSKEKCHCDDDWSSQEKHCNDDWWKSKEKCFVMMIGVLNEISVVVNVSLFVAIVKGRIGNIFDVNLKARICLWNQSGFSES